MTGALASSRTGHRAGAAAASRPIKLMIVDDSMVARAVLSRMIDADGGIHEAAVVELDGHHYALTVDAVEDVVDMLSEPVAVRAAMSPGWERVSKGVVETEQGPLLLVDVAGLIAGPGAELRAA